MSHAILHLTEEFISEDLDYYFSTKRDKNNQVRPNENIYSMTPGSTHFCQTLDDEQVSNFFFPCMPNLLDRIYIGTSVPLFANNWGASFLLQLLKILRPGGAIILPVYPEIQAQEKGYWSRSFLENTFLSRKRWTGFSNVIAENDGVMSLQVGRKWPAPIPSTIEWFYQQRCNLALQVLLESGDSNGNTIERFYTSLVENVWNNYTYSAVIERILSDNFAPKKPVSFHNISDDYGLLLTELLLSRHINIINGITTDVCTSAKSIIHNLKSYFYPKMDEHHKIEPSRIEEISFHQRSDIISIINVLSPLDEPEREAMLRLAWENLRPEGLLIVHDNSKIYSYDVLGEFGELQAYSTIVASKVQHDHSISHYSSIQESKLLDEKNDQGNIFLAVKKSSNKDKMLNRGNA